MEIHAGNCVYPLDHSVFRLPHHARVSQVCEKDKFRRINITRGEKERHLTLPPPLMISWNLLNEYEIRRNLSLSLQSNCRDIQLSSLFRYQKENTT